MSEEPVKEEVWPPKPAPTEPTFGDTQALKWLRRTFSKPALGLIATMALAFGGYVVRQESRFTALESQLRNLEHDMPHGDGGVTGVRDELSHVRETVAVFAVRIDAQERHLEANDEKIDDVLDVIDPRAIKKERPFSKRNRK